MKRALLGLILLLGCSKGASAMDVVGGWTDTFCDAVKSLIQTTAGPCRTSRTGAMMYLAMHDAVNSITREYEPYAFDALASPTASTEAAATTAAYEILMAAYPTRAYLFTPRYEGDLAQIADGPAKTEGVDVGRAAAAAMIALRAGDGMGDPVVYEPVLEPGHWRPTWPEYRAAKDPGYGRVTPFGLESADQFPRSVPPAIDSPEYFEAWDEVRRIGGLTSYQEGALEWEIGWFWANDQDGTYKANGHIYQMTKSIADAAGLAFEDRVHLFGLMGLAAADAAIAGWYSKYETEWDVWRPVTGIREADTDGNPLTEADPNWVPLSYVTPNFPAYVSGHACFAGASSQLLRRYFGTDEMVFVVPTADPHLLPGWTRTMHSFSQAENENADSRIFIGVHWRFDCDDALRVGHHVGDWIYDNYLQRREPLVAGVPDGLASRALLDLMWPNPSAGPTNLRFMTEVPGLLHVTLFDAAGRRVHELSSRRVEAGVTELNWNGRAVNQELIAPGVYYVGAALNGSALGTGGEKARLVVLR